MYWLWLSNQSVLCSVNQGRRVTTTIYSRALVLSSGQVKSTRRLQHASARVAAHGSDL